MNGSYKNYMVWFWIMHVIGIQCCPALSVQQETMPWSSALLKSFKAAPHTFILVISLYDEVRPKRIEEYIACLEKNLAHPRIAHIHVVFEHNQDTHSVILDYLLSKNISINFVKTKPSFGLLFDIVNNYYADQQVIVSNADIYFNETLNLLDEYDLTDKFLALTRWDVKADGTLTPYFKVKNTYSQDTWIFKAPLKKFKDASMLIGTCGSDNKIAFQAGAVGLQVLNPCWSIQCCHLHLSNLRTYIKCLGFAASEKDYMFIDWSYLDGTAP